MNILNLLTTKRHIVGIEISDQAIKISYLQTRQKGEVNKDIPQDKLILIEEQLPQGIIANGVILDKEALTQILKNIWEKENLSKSYAVVSIEEDKIYSHILSFPKTIDNTKIKEAVLLAIDFQIPINKNDYYIGWELNENNHNINKVLISAISKNIANDYIKILDHAGINIMALESNLASLSRSIKTNPEELTIITKENRNSFTLFCLKNKAYQFSRTIPNSFIKDEDHKKNEISKIKNSFESETKEKSRELSLNQGELIEEYTKYPEIKESNDQSKWLIAIGAFMRGKIPQGEDKNC